MNESGGKDFKDPGSESCIYSSIHNDLHFRSNPSLLHVATPINSEEFSYLIEAQEIRAIYETGSS